MQENNAIKDFTFYYKFLIRTFGHADCAGCRAVAYILNEYQPGMRIQDIYKKYAEDINSTPSAVERSVRVYLACIAKDYSIEDISTMLDYAFKPGETSLKISELAPVLKFVLDHEG